MLTKQSAAGVGLDLTMHASTVWGLKVKFKSDASRRALGSRVLCAGGTFVTMDCIPAWHTFCHHFETSRATQARWVQDMRQTHATWVTRIQEKGSILC